MGRGDYYRGDYYRGDPGLFGSIGRALGRVAQLGIGTVGGFIKGGPAGAITGTIAGLPAVLSRGIRQETLAAGPEGSAYTPALRAAHAAAVARGPARGAGIQGLPAPMVGPPSLDGRPAGMHLMKSGPLKGQVYVKNRRMNWANPRALARAERRARMFLRHASHFIRYFNPSKKKGRPYIRRARKKR